MDKSKFHNCFKQLELKEQKEFQQYIFANHAQKTTATAVFSHYFTELSQDSSVISSKEQAFTLIFGRQHTYSYRKITDALSDLYLLLEEFLLWKEIKNPEMSERDLLLLEVFRKRNMNQLLPMKIKAYRKKLEVQEAKDMWFYLSKMKLSYFEYSFLNIEVITEKAATEAKATIEYLDNFFIITKLKIGTELISRESVLQEEHTINFLEEILEIFQ
ncbi:MAG: hypothetical protein AB8G15_16890, partial [Saprospiraceae bacterium]